MSRLPWKPCVQCGKNYRPTRWAQKYCKPDCFYETLKTPRNYRPRKAATGPMHAANRARSRARIQAEFGALTDREIALVKLALMRGYQKGYHKARTENRREAA